MAFQSQNDKKTGLKKHFLILGPENDWNKV